MFPSGLHFALIQRSPYPLRPVLTAIAHMWAQGNPTALRTDFTLCLPCCTILAIHMCLKMRIFVSYLYKPLLGKPDCSVKLFAGIAQEPNKNLQRKAGL